MRFTEILYYLFMLSAGISAILILFVENLFKAVLLLLIVLLSIAAIYVLSFAEFLAVTQILIYAGGVVVIMLFGIMLTSKTTSGVALNVKTTNIFPAALTGCLLIYLLVSLLTKDFSDAEAGSIDLNSTRETGISLMTSHLLAFEVTAILLLAALIGAAVISSGNKNSTVK